MNSTTYDASGSSEGVRQLNSLLRGEISAAETYRMALDELSDSTKPELGGQLNLLKQVQEDHARAAQAIRERIKALGGSPSDSSGAWGAWAQTVQGTANLLGDTSALKSLKEGEEHGLKDYEEALDDVDSASSGIISSQFIPAQQRHINLLNQLMNSVGRA